MQVAIDKNNIRIMASDAEKGKIYSCPLCKGEVTLRQGEKNIWHFAHKANECRDSWNYDMSEWHLRMQEQFPEKYREVVINNKGQVHRADIVKDDMIIEFQHSPISSEELHERNSFFNEAGYKVAWVFDFSEQYELGYIEDYPSDKNVLMYKWSNPKRFLNCFPQPKENSKDVILFFYWVDDEEECFNRIIWSTPNDVGEPDFKRFIVNSYIITKKISAVESCFKTNQDRLNEYIISIGKFFVIKRSGVKGYPRDTYVCPKENVFGIKEFGENGCLYCKYCAAIKEYARGFDSYCFYPNEIRLIQRGHPGYECGSAPRY